MGVNGAHTLTYSLPNIKSEQLYLIGLFLYNKPQLQTKRTPCIYIDASWVLRQCSVEGRVQYLVRLCTHLVSIGFRVVVVCDGSVRHHSKRSTTKRLAESYTSKIALNKNNSFLISLISKKESSDSLSEIAEIEAAMKVVSTRVNKLQGTLKRSNINVGEKTFNKIKEEIKKINLDQSLLYAIQSEFQADSTLAWAINTQEADMLLSTDSDLAALLGHRCVAIKNFTYQDQNKVKVLKDLDFFSADYNTIHEIAVHLNEPIENTKEHQYLTFCDKHKLQSEMIEYSWKNKAGTKIFSSSMTVLPVNRKVAKLPPTRANRMLIHLPPPRRQKMYQYALDDLNIKQNAIIDIVDKDNDNDINTMMMLTTNQLKLMTIL
jgi:hypothetical protein